MKKAVHIIMCSVLVIALALMCGCGNDKSKSKKHQEEKKDSVYRLSEKKKLDDGMIECETCEGTGDCILCSTGDGKCDSCNGTKEMECVTCAGTVDCSVCRGRGDTYGGEECTVCSGDGECQFCDDGMTKCLYCDESVECSSCYDTGECALCDGRGGYEPDDKEDDYYDEDDYEIDDYETDDLPYDDDYYSSDEDDDCYTCYGRGYVDCSYCNNGYCRNCGGLGYNITYYGDCMQCTTGKCSVCGGTDREDCPDC